MKATDGGGGGGGSEYPQKSNTKKKKKDTERTFTGQGPPGVINHSV